MRSFGWICCLVWTTVPFAVAQEDTHHMRGSGVVTDRQVRNGVVIEIADHDRTGGG